MWGSIQRKPPASPLTLCPCASVRYRALGRRTKAAHGFAYVEHPAAEPLRLLSVDLEALSGVGAVPKPRTGSPMPVRFDPLSVRPRRQGRSRARLCSCASVRYRASGRVAINTPASRRVERIGVSAMSAERIGRLAVESLDVYSRLRR
jgi:hypothetical protein